MRQMHPGLRFSFNSMFFRAVDKIAIREPQEQKAMDQRVQEAIANLGPNLHAASGQFIRLRWLFSIFKSSGS